MTEDECRSRMERALEWGGPTHRIGDVAQLIKDGRAQWWSNGEGMIVTEVVTYPLYKACNYWLIFGSLKECLALDAEISEWAVGEGCTMATATGRKGWGRVAQPFGWQPHLYTFYKRLAS